MNVVSIIRKKRDRQELSEQEIHYLIQQYSKDLIPDYQMSALLMAIFINGLNTVEASAFTKEMLYSGKVLDLSDIPGVKVDKHSTGGVGDKISLLLAPIVAACGVPVPMISGRGLGHSGGTLDKLESIRGFNVHLDLNRYRQVLQKHGIVLIGQTEEIAPADKRMYALRDVTATVECIPLIAGSIMSKKLAEGIDALVLDVKWGNGAFMKTQEDALTLAETLVSIGESFGKRTIAYLTDMNQPLGYAIGNWNEVQESIDGLLGKGPEDIMELTHLLSGTMIYLGEKATSVEEGILKSKQAVENGAAFDKFLDIVQEQGGEIDQIKNYKNESLAPVSQVVYAEKSGTISEIDSLAMGMAGIELGAGRKTKEDTIDPRAGIQLHKKIGDSVEKGDALYTLYSQKEEDIHLAKTVVLNAVSIVHESVKQPKLISHRIDRDGIHVYES